MKPVPPQPIRTYEGPAGGKMPPPGRGGFYRRTLRHACERSCVAFNGRTSAGGGSEDGATQMGGVTNLEGVGCQGNKVNKGSF